MWKLMPFIGKEQAGLEGRTVNVGNVKVHIHNAIAEGGFSCVYLARDVVHPSKQYALKHMICNDSESLDLVMKEISVMKLLNGHPNIVSLVAHTILDMGRTNEAILLLEFCEKPLVSVLENRGAGFFEEKQALLIFRDVCNAVFAMHNQSPPIAHRDLKVENVLLGFDGAWKLCDFGSISTNHKCFDRPEEMGLEEDNIRKHTTPAYRAPEMWDLLRKEVISEKVDIWALGCLLYRICYLKSAFDGESKLQILNGNYRIPELPKYSASIKGLIKDMLEASPDARPDITQVWFRVNELLPVELQKSLPDKAASTFSAHLHSNSHDEVCSAGSKTTSMMPRRSPAPQPSLKEPVQNLSPVSEKEIQQRGPPQATSKADGGPMGAFWSMQNALDSGVIELKGPLFDEQVKVTVKPIQNSPGSKARSASEQHIRPQQPRRSAGNPITKTDDDFTEDFDIRSSSQYGSQKTKASIPESKPTTQNETFNAFVADFGTGKFNSDNSSNSSTISGRRGLEAEVDRLKEQLKQTNLDKAEITSKYEKLSAICRSQRQEIQELKRALATATPSPQGKESTTLSASLPSGTLHRKKIEGTIWELEQGLLANSSTLPGPEEPKPWNAFAEEPKPQPASKNNHPRSTGTINGHQNSLKQSPAGPSNTFNFGLGLFTTASGGSQVTRTSAQENTSQRFSIGGTKKVETDQPSGWAGF